MRAWYACECICALWQCAVRVYFASLSLRVVVARTVHLHLLCAFISRSFRSAAGRCAHGTFAFAVRVYFASLSLRAVSVAFALVRSSLSVRAVAARTEHLHLLCAFISLPSRSAAGRCAHGTFAFAVRVYFSSLFVRALAALSVRFVCWLQNTVHIIPRRSRTRCCLAELYWRNVLHACNTHVFARFCSITLSTL